MSHWAQQALSLAGLGTCTKKWPVPNQFFGVLFDVKRPENRTEKSITWIVMTRIGVYVGGLPC